MNSGHEDSVKSHFVNVTAVRVRHGAVFGFISGVRDRASTQRITAPVPQRKQRKL